MTEGQPVGGMAAVEKALLAAGAPFEIREEEVLGERVRVFANRPRSLRDVLLRAREFGDAEYMMFRDGDEDRRFTFREHEKRVAQMAAALRDRYGVQPGDRVPFSLPTARSGSLRFGRRPVSERSASA